VSAPAAFFERVRFAYPRQPEAALDGVDWDLKTGTLTLLAGPSGSGKSTLLRCLNGLVPHFTGGRFGGRVLVAGRDTRETPPRELAAQVGFVFQDPEAQFVTTRVDDEIAFGMEQLGVAPATMRRRVDEALALAGIGTLRSRDVSTLSGGERQKVAIAAALAPRPHILALDEPTSQLDPWSAEEVLAAVARLHQDLGLTVVLAEHRLSRVIALADRMRLLGNRGLAVADGRPASVLPQMDRDAVPALAALGLARGWEPLPLSVEEAREWVAAERRTGRLPAEPPLDPPVPAGPPAIEASGLAVGYGGVPVLRGVEFAARPGELVALMGRNGSGKTTLLRALLGFQVPERGRVAVGGREVTRARPADRAETIGYVPQNPSSILFAEKLRDELAFTLRFHPNGHRPEETLSEVGLTWAADRHPRDLSGGERERAALAAILVGNPSVLLLDEPTRGMDAASKLAMVEALRRRCRLGGTVVLATHDVELAAAATRVVMLDEGRVVADGDPRTVLPAVPAYATPISALYGGRFLTTEDVLAGYGERSLGAGLLTVSGGVS
jgi:energy-coupling factor transport system ATP-binding protein